MKLFAGTARKLSAHQRVELIGQWMVLISPGRDMYRSFGTVCKIREIITEDDMNSILLYNINNTQCGPIRVGEHWETIDSIYDLDRIANTL